MGSSLLYGVSVPMGWMSFTTVHLSTHLIMPQNIDIPWTIWEKKAEILTNHSADSIWDQEYFYMCLLNGIGQTLLHRFWQMGQEVLQVGTDHSNKFYQHIKILKVKIRNYFFFSNEYNINNTNSDTCII